MRDLVQRGLELLLGREAGAALEFIQDRIPRLPADADDEGKAETLAVGLVQGFKPVEFRVAQPVEAKAALFRDRFSRHRAGAGDLAAEFGMAAQEGELRLARRLPDGLHHRFMQRGDRGEGPAGRQRPRPPRPHVRKCRPRRRRKPLRAWR